MIISKKIDLDSLRENKREMFDGMRAYHQSEISNTNQSVTMLLAIAGATGTAVLAMLFPEKPPEHLTAIAWGLFIVVATLSLTIAITSHIKISSDHATYSNYGVEYVKTSKLLGFYERVQINDMRVEIKTNDKIGQGKGYQKTQFIIWSFAIALIILAFLFAVHSSHFVPQSTPIDTNNPVILQQKCD